jgi:hypothetical protein
LQSDFHQTIVVQPLFGVGMLRGGLTYSKLSPAYILAAAAAAIGVVGVIACSKETSQHPLLHTDPS